MEEIKDINLFMIFIIVQKYLIWTGIQLGLFDEVRGQVTRITQAAASSWNDGKTPTPYKDVFIRGADYEVYRLVTRHPNVSAGDYVRIIYRPGYCKEVGSLSIGSLPIKFTRDFASRPIKVEKLPSL